MVVKDKPQTSFDEEQIENPQLLEELEAWSKKENSRKALAKQASEAKDKALATIETLELPLGEYRVGEFKVTIKETEARDVEFHVESKRQVRLGAPKGE